MYDTEKSMEDELMEIKKSIGKGFMRFLNVLALLLVVQTANSACIWVSHQPEFPKDANRFRI